MRGVKGLKISMSPARKGLAAIASGAAIGQVVLVVAAPLLSRLYDPDSFGAFSVVNAVVLAVGTVAALRLELAVPLPKSDTEARGIVRLGFLFAVGVVVIGTPLVYLLRSPIASFSGWSSEVTSLLVWAPLGAALLGTYLLLNQLAVRRRSYGAIARRTVLQASATVLLQVTFGAVGWGAFGLVLGLVAGQVVGVATLGWSLRHVLRFAAPARPQLRSLLSEYRSFPLILAPSGLVNTLGLQVPLLVITSLYGNASAGLFGMAQRVVALPVILVGGAIGQVFVGELASRRRGSSTALMPLFTGVSKRLAAVGVAGAATVLIAAPTVFAFLLGDEWRASGQMARALSVGLLVQLVAAPVSQAAIIAGKNLVQLLWDVGRFVLCLAAVVGAWWAGYSDVSAVWWLSAATAVSYAASWWISRWAVLGMDRRTDAGSTTLAS